MSYSHRIQGVPENYCALQRWDEILLHLGLALNRTGHCISLKLIFDTAGTSKLVATQYLLNNYPQKYEVPVSGDTNYLQTISDIFNAICPATPKDIPAAKPRTRKTASRGKEAV